jgi:hypothetical protein
MKEIATRALAEVQVRIKEEDTASTRKISISSRVVERGSCGAVPADAAA